jgi:hypothetical protein
MKIENDLSKSRNGKPGLGILIFSGFFIKFDYFLYSKFQKQKNWKNLRFLWKSFCCFLIYFKEIYKLEKKNM